jgi:hypothetical protein
LGRTDDHAGRDGSMAADSDVVADTSHGSGSLQDSRGERGGGHTGTRVTIATSEALVRRNLTRTSLYKLTVKEMAHTIRHLHIPVCDKPRRKDYLAALQGHFEKLPRGSAVTVPLPASPATTALASAEPSLSRASAAPSSSPRTFTVAGTLPLEHVPRLHFEDVKYHCTRRGIALRGRTSDTPHRDRCAAVFFLPCDV